MVVGQTIKVRRKGMGWSRPRNFRISAIGDKGMLGYWESNPNMEVWINHTSHEWEENAKD